MKKNQQQEAAVKGTARGRKSKSCHLYLLTFIIGGLIFHGFILGSRPTTSNAGPLSAYLSSQFNAWRELGSEKTSKEKRRGTPHVDPPIPIEDLVTDFSNMSQTCKKHDLYLMEDVVLPKAVTHRNRKIPQVIHVTSRTRCMTKPFFDNLNSWKFENHSFYFHDDEAVEKLLGRFWPEFPNLQLVMSSCLVSGAAMADLWRYVVLWEYGGIYTDIDNAPGPSLKNGTDILADDDAYFLQEMGGFPSQYFFAISPKHPAMFMAVTATLHRLMSVDNVGAQYVPFVTGPGALCEGFESFVIRRPGDERNYHKPPAGMYHGIENRTARVVGSRRTNGEWVIRSALGGEAKRSGWEKMGMTHYNNLIAVEANNMSCYRKIHETISKQGLGSPWRGNSSDKGTQ